jgi:hypothetical protein
MSAPNAGGICLRSEDLKPGSGEHQRQHIGDSKHAISRLSSANSLS